MARRFQQSDVPIVGMLLIGILPNWLKLIYYRMKGAQIGRGVKLGWFSYISSPQIVLEDGSKVGHLSFATTRRRFRLGKRSKIGMMVAIDTGEVDIDCDSNIMEQTVIGGMLTPRSKITIGQRVKIFPYCFLNPTEPIVIEDEVGIGGANYLFTHGSWPNVLEGYPYAFGPIHIEKGTWLQWRVFVTPRVHIGRNTVIGADSTVTKSLPEQSLAAGSPARVIKQGDNFISAWSLEQKDAKLREIFAEFSEYIAFIGMPNKVTNELSGCDIIEDRCAKKVFSYRRQFTPAEPVECEILVSLGEILSGDRKLLEEKNIGWFDLSNLESGVRHGEEWEEMKNFLTRFGIRVQVLEY